MKFHDYTIEQVDAIADAASGEAARSVLEKLGEQGADLPENMQDTIRMGFRTSMRLTLELIHSMENDA